MRKFVAFCVAMSSVAPMAIHASAAEIYWGGTIITMEGDKPATVEAVTVSDGRIVAAGSREMAKAAAGRDYKTIDLAGRTLLPGFIDAHGHVSAAGAASRMADLSPPPRAGIASIAQLQDALRAFPFPASSKALVGSGYDDSQLAERRHPTRHDLDAVSSTRPIMIMHVSGHLAVMNTPMLELAGIGANTPDPAGGVIRREADGRTPNGVLEETAAMLGWGHAGMEGNEVANLLAGMRQYARNGITTAQEGYLAAQAWNMIPAARRVALPIDVVVLLGGRDQWPEAVLKQIGKPYDKRIRIGGFKFMLDGSPQGRTAYLTQPVWVAPEGKDPSYRGYPVVEDAWLKERFALAARNDWQVFAHANGDAAMDMLIKAVRDSGLAGHRTIAIHAQVTRPDQLPQMRDLDIQPSFFANHTWYWGDWHREVALGPERADFISPQKSAWNAGLRPTIHNDAPVVPPDIMRLLWSAVNRRTQSGDILGAAERMDVYRALQEVTVNAAWQIREDDAKGTIATGKRADFVILDRNPLETPAQDLAAIRVMATIKDGVTVFSEAR